MKHSYGIQLYSVRDLSNNDLSSALKGVAELGYTSVEFAGFFGHSAYDVKAMLDNYGLAVVGTHSGFEDLRPENIIETVKYHKAIGNPNYIVPGARLDTLEYIDDFCNVMNFAQPILKAEGINLGYHNHSGEFVVMNWGSTIHSELEKRTSIDFEIDTYWAFNAGCDPIAVLDRLKSRIKLIHLKDGFMGGKGMALGEGEAPVKAIRDHAEKLGFGIVVESETLTPDGISEVGRCIDFLKTIDD